LKRGVVKRQTTRARVVISLLQRFNALTSLTIQRFQ
jgi:hypothetical protein